MALFAAPAYVKANGVSEPWARWFGDPIVLLTIVLAVSTVLMWWETRRTALSTRVTVDELRRQFNASYRARIVVRNFAAENFGEAFKLGFIIANVGDTECTVTEFYAGAFVGNADPGLLTFDHPPPMTKGTLPSRVAAGAAFPVGAQLESLPANEVISIRSKTLQLYVHGYIGYVDGNGVKRRTGYLRKYDALSGAFLAVNHPDYEYQD